MAIPESEHYFDQAVKLATPPAAGVPRQVDLRRAYSAIYYGLFHAIMKDVADFVVGSTNRVAPQYSLFYRSIEHKTIRETAEDIGKKTFSSKYSHYVPIGGFTEEMKEFAAAICELQEKRHEADYDPHVRMKRSDVPAVVSTARAALAKYKSASADQRRAFLLLLLLKARPRDKDG